MKFGIPSSHYVNYHSKANHRDKETRGMGKARVESSVTHKTAPPFSGVPAVFWKKQKLRENQNESYWAFNLPVQPSFVRSVEK